MSGLELCFRACPPSQKANECDSNNNISTADEVGLHNQEISQRLCPPDDNDEEGDENDDINDAIKYQAQYPTDTSVVEESSFYSTYTAPVDWKTWHQHQKEVLAKFMEERLFDSDDSNVTDSVSNEPSDEPGIEEETDQNHKSTLITDEDELRADADVECETTDKDDTAEDETMLETQDPNCGIVSLSKTVETNNDKNVGCDNNLETQEELIASTTLLSDSTATTHNRKRKRVDQMKFYSVPTLSETKHNVHYLTDIDLYTHQATLQLTLVDKYWPIRSIRRPSLVNAPPRKHNVYHGCSRNGMAPELVRIPYKYCQYDGPMHTCYKKVMSIEVSQLVVDNRIRELADNCFRDMDGCYPRGQSHRPDRLRVFFYNNYATELQNIIAAAQSAINTKRKVALRDPMHKTQSTCTGNGAAQRLPSKLLISLENIPAICVFPYPPSDWFDQHHFVPFCLCIGDNSVLNRTTKDVYTKGFEANGFDNHNSHSTSPSVVVTKESVRCDAKDLVINVGIVDGDTAEIEEYQIRPIDMNVTAFKVKDNQCIMLERYVTYRNAQHTISSPIPWKRSKRKIDVHSEGETKPLHKVGHDSVGDIKTKQAGESTPESDLKQRLATPTRNVANASFGMGDNGVDTFMSSAKLTAATLSNKSKHMSRASESPKKTHRLKDKSMNKQKRPAMLYTKLNELESFLQQRNQSIGTDRLFRKLCDVNVMGVVITYKPPFRTKRGEWMTNATIVDDSLDLDKDRILSVSVNLFSKTKDRLPEFKYAGDILRLHRVRVQKWQDELQLLGMVNSSYVVGRGQEADPTAFTFIPTSNQMWNPAVEDTERFKFLWQWGQKRILKHPTMNSELEHAFKISDLMYPQGTNDISNIKKITSGDATMMITSIIDNVRAGEIVPPLLTGNPCGFLRVWDGTGPSESDVLPVDTIAAQQSIHDGDPPRVSVMKIGSIINNKIKNIQAPKALVGRVTNIVVWEPEHWKMIKDIVSVGSFIRMRNVIYEIIPNSTSHALQIHSKSSITPLPEYTYEVIQLLVAHSNRVLNGDHFNETSGLLPLHFRQAVATDGQDDTRPSLTVDKEATTEIQNNGQHSSLEELISGGVGQSFTGPAYVRDLIPKCAVITAVGVETIISDDDTPSFQFAISISLDAAGTNPIDAIAVDAVGMVLLGMSARDALLNKTEALNNVVRAVNDPVPWNISAKSIMYEKKKFFLLETIKRF